MTHARRKRQVTSSDASHEQSREEEKHRNEQDEDTQGRAFLMNPATEQDEQGGDLPVQRSIRKKEETRMDAHQIIEAVRQVMKEYQSKTEMEKVPNIFDLRCYRFRIQNPITS